MPSIKHVTNTWLLAVHLFAVFGLLYDIITRGNTEFGLLLFLVLFGAVFSLPSLAVCLLVFPHLSKAALTATAKLVLWLFILTLLVIGNAALVCCLFTDSFITWQEEPFVACAVIAAWMAILLRLNFFFQLIIPQTRAYENEVV